MFNINNNNNLQSKIILNNEAIVLKSFIHIFDMASTFFSLKLTF
jgi:hypothetical protein